MLADMVWRQPFWAAGDRRVGWRGLVLPPMGMMLAILSEDPKMDEDIPLDSSRARYGMRYRRFAGGYGRTKEGL